MKTRILLIALALAFAGCATNKGPQLPPPIPIELEQAKK